MRTIEIARHVVWLPPLSPHFLALHCVVNGDFRRPFLGDCPIWVSLIVGFISYRSSTLFLVLNIKTEEDIHTSLATAQEQ
jgi:hypothetical protein